MAANEIAFVSGSGKKSLKQVSPTRKSNFLEIATINVKEIEREKNCMRPQPPEELLKQAEMREAYSV